MWEAGGLTSLEPNLNLPSSSTSSQASAWRPGSRGEGVGGTAGCRDTASEGRWLTSLPDPGLGPSDCHAPTFSQLPPLSACSALSRTGNWKDLNTLLILFSSFSNLKIKEQERHLRGRCLLQRGALLTAGPRLAHSRP